RGGHRAAPTALPGGAAPAGARARTRAPAHVTASGSSHRGSSCQQGGAAGAPLERGDEVRKRLRQKVLARDAGGRDRPLDTGRLAHPQPQDLVPIRQPVTAVEAPVEHVAPELEHRARTHQRGAQRGGIIDPRLDLELVDGCGRGPAHAKMASRTAAVSASVANTYTAPAARSAATS